MLEVSWYYYCHIKVAIVFLIQMELGHVFFVLNLFSRTLHVSSIHKVFSLI